MNRIPFSLPDVGLREIRGKVYLTDDFLILEMEDSLVGEFDTDVFTIEIEPGALDEVRFERRLLKDRLVLRPRTRRLLEVVPGNHTREVALEIWRKHRSDTIKLERALKIRCLRDSE